MDPNLALAWGLSLFAEFALTMKVRSWRSLYGKFYLYLLFDLIVSVILFGLAEFRAGNKFYARFAITAMVIQIAFRGVVSYEAARRMHLRTPFHLQSMILVFGASAFASTWIFLELHAETRWPESWLEIVYALRAGVDCFLACGLTALSLLPVRRHHVMKIEGRHSIILAVYLWMNSAAYFSVTTSAISTKLMWIAGACFLLWYLSFWRRAPGARFEPKGQDSPH